MIDVRQFISRVKLGRPPTPLGNDGIDPWVEVPRRFTPALVRRLSLEGVSHSVREFAVIDDDRYGVFVMLDAVSFPSAGPKQLQLILDDWRARLE